MRAIVVGGGVIGTACAVALLEVADEVVLLEADTICSGASAGNAGWVSPSIAMPLASPGVVRTGLRSALDPRGALVIRPALEIDWLRWLWRFSRSTRPAVFRSGVRALLGMTMRSLEELDRLRAAGVAFEEHRQGLLAVARDRHGLHWLEQAFAVLREVGFAGALEGMDGPTARELEPALGDAVGWAVRTDVDRHVAPETLVEGLAAHLRASGAVVRERAPVRHLRPAGLRWGLDGDDGPLDQGDLVVLAAALGTAPLARPLGLRLPLIGAKGYSVTLPAPEVVPTRPLYLCEAKLGVSPFARGMRIAGIFELGAKDGSPSPARARQLVEDAARYLRSLSPGEPLEGAAGWAGFRPATPDGLPLIGPVPGVPGVLLATGHGMLGVTLAPATGAAVAALARGERPGWVAPFDPARLVRR
jgi:D-amino-acid dehydrogenase